MKKVLLGGKRNFYKANLHCHSNLSDGTLSPEELKDLYKGAGYSILAITDHESIRCHSYLDDEDFLTVTAMEIAIKERLVSTSVDRHMKVCHLNVYAKEQENDYNVCYSAEYDKYSKKERVAAILEKSGADYKRVYGADGINDIIDTANKNGFLVCYNHPAWSLENYTHYSKYDGLWAVEVFNTECVREGIFEYNQQVLDDLLRMEKKVFPIAADDNHNASGTADSFGGFIMVNADELKYKNVMDSLEAGDFYASTGPLIDEVLVEGDSVTVKCSNAKFIGMSTSGRRCECLHAEGGSYVTEATFKYNPDDIYFRIDVVDEHGNRANTRAFFIDEI